MMTPQEQPRFPGGDSPGGSGVSTRGVTLVCDQPGQTTNDDGHALRENVSSEGRLNSAHCRLVLTRGAAGLQLSTHFSRGGELYGLLETCMVVFPPEGPLVTATAALGRWRLCWRSPLLQPAHPHTPRPMVPSTVLSFTIA